MSKDITSESFSYQHKRNNIFVNFILARFTFKHKSIYTNRVKTLHLFHRKLHLPYIYMRTKTVMKSAETFVSE